MISELDETIRQILVREGGLDPAQIDVSFELPSREWSAGLARPTVSCYLFDIRENLALRTAGRGLEQGGGGAQRRQSAARYDVTYLVTGWTRAVEDEHRLLWRALQALARFPIIPPERMPEALRDTPQPIYATVGRPDGVLKSQAELWSALDNQIKPALVYTVTVGMDRDAAPAGPPVLGVEVRVDEVPGRAG